MNQVSPIARSPAALTVTSVEGQSQIQWLLQQSSRLADPVQEGGRLTLTAPMSADMARQIGTAIASLDRSLSTPCRSSTVDQACLRMSAMPMAAGTDIDARLRLSLLKDALSDVEMNGVIPNEVVMQVAREFALGKHGKWFPSPGEFVTVCRERVKPLQRQLWKLRRVQSAQVRAPMPEADRERQRRRVAELMAGFVTPKQEAAE